MNSPAHDLALYLSGLMIGQFPYSNGTWALSVSWEVEGPPDNAITLYDTSGTGPDTDDLNPVRVTLQVRVRSRDYPTAYSKQIEIRNALIKAAFPIVAATSRFVGIDVQSDVMSIGVDENNRHLLVANYRALRHEP